MEWYPKELSGSFIFFFQSRYKCNINTEYICIYIYLARKACVLLLFFVLFCLYKGFISIFVDLNTSCLFEHTANTIGFIWSWNLIISVCIATLDRKHLQRRNFMRIAMACLYSSFTQLKFQFFLNSINCIDKRTLVFLSAHKHIHLSLMFGRKV